MIIPRLFLHHQSAVYAHFFSNFF